jgi:hypothetical protein
MLLPQMPRHLVGTTIAGSLAPSTPGDGAEMEALIVTVEVGHVAGQIGGALKCATAVGAGASVTLMTCQGYTIKK